MHTTQLKIWEEEESSPPNDKPTQSLIKELMLKAVDDLIFDWQRYGIEFYSIRFIALTHDHKILQSDEADVLNANRLKYGICFLTFNYEYSYLDNNEEEVGYMQIIIDENLNFLNEIEENGWVLKISSVTIGDYPYFYDKELNIYHKLIDIPEISCYISLKKGQLIDDFETIWEYFHLFKRCTTKIEADFLQAQFEYGIKPKRFLMYRDFIEAAEEREKKQIINKHHKLFRKIEYKNGKY